jgi:hypothetical protein
MKTADELLLDCWQKGITIIAAGDVLDIEAPKGILTDELREALKRHKPTLLQLLRKPTEYVSLKNGPTLPVPALTVAWGLERRGFSLTLNADEHVNIQPANRLTDADRAAITRWRFHLGAIVAYQPPEVG